MFDKIFARIDTYGKKVIDLQRLLVATPALAPENGGDGESAKAQALMEFLRKEGFPEPEFYPAADPRVSTGQRPNLVYRLPGKSTAKRVWIMSHLDVVPAGELSTWKSDPFQLVVEGDKLIGRGVEDNHHGMVASIIAAKAFLEEQITPGCALNLLFVADEEVGSNYGINYLLNNHNLFDRNDLIIVPDAGHPSGTAIEVAEKSIFWLKIHTKGKQAHGSRPDQAKNAFRAASHLVTRLDSLYAEFNQRDPLFDPPYSTFEPTKKEANVPNINTIPGDDVFYLDCRVLPGQRLDDIEARINTYVAEVEQKYEVKINVFTVQKTTAALPTPSDAPVVLALAAAIERVYGAKARPYGIGGGTVAATFRRAGYPAAVWSRIHEVAHQPNEYTFISNIIGDAKVFAHVAAFGDLPD